MIPRRTLTPPRTAAPAASIAVALILGLCGAALYSGLAVARLDLPGAYYDELNKAVPAFAWVGRPSHMFSEAHLAGIPAMVMKYKAATEGWIYGALRLAAGRPFTIESWRLFSIGEVAIAIVAFCILARWALSPASLALVLLLIVLDSTVILGTRLNWGPVTLGLVERLLLVGIYLRGIGRNPASPWTAFALGAVVGFAVFDKLVSVVIAAPVALWLLLDAGGNRVRRLLAAVAGGFTGGLPLLLINLKWLWSYGALFSLGEVRGSHEHSGGSLFRVLFGCLTLGTGPGFSTEMLGRPPAGWATALEGACVATALAATLVLAVRSWRGPLPQPRIGGLFALSWLATVGGLYALPEVTHHHHWAVTIPFLPIAAAIGLSGWARSPRPRHGAVRMAGGALAAAVLLLIAARVVATVQIQTDLREGRVTRKWDPGLNALGSFASTRPPDAGFVAAGWGVGTQIFCFSQGRGRYVDEVYWNYRGREQLSRHLAERGEWKTVYLVALEPPVGPLAEVPARIFSDALALPGWKVAPLEPEIEAITCIRARKLVRDP